MIACAAMSAPARVPLAIALMPTRAADGPCPRQPRGPESTQNMPIGPVGDPMLRLMRSSSDSRRAPTASCDSRRDASNDSRRAAWGESGHNPHVLAAA